MVRGHSNSPASTTIGQPKNETRNAVTSIIQRLILSCQSLPPPFIYGLIIVLVRSMFKTPLVSCHRKLGRRTCANALS